MKFRRLIRQGIVLNMEDAVILKEKDEKKHAVTYHLVINEVMMDFEGINGYLCNQDAINCFLRQASRLWPHGMNVITLVLVLESQSKS